MSFIKVTQGAPKFQDFDMQPVSARTRSRIQAAQKRGTRTLKGRKVASKVPIKARVLTAQLNVPPDTRGAKIGRKQKIFVKQVSDAQKQGNTTPLSSLPKELQFEILRMQGPPGSKEFARVIQLFSEEEQLALWFYRKEEAASTALQEAAGNMQRIPEKLKAVGTSIKELNLHSLALNAEQVREIVKFFPDIEKLHLLDCGLDDNAVIELCALKNLTYLDLSNFSRLIYGHKRSFTDQVVQALLSKTPKLSELHLDNTNVTGSCFHNVPPNNNLRILSISGTHLTNDGLKHLSTYAPNIEELSASSCHRFTDQGISHLNATKNLHRLDLSFTDITDKGIQDLKLSGISITRTACKYKGILRN